MNQEGEEVAMGAYNFANIILRQLGDLVKAEELAREALRIRTLIFDSNNQEVGYSCNLLADVLRLKNSLGDETRKLYERSLAIVIRNEGPDRPNSASGYRNIGLFYEQLAKFQTTADAKRTQLLLAKSHYEKASIIYMKIFGPSHPETVINTSSLADTLRKLS
jgi:tetratricopeptide (TPR) repeat protein